LKSALLELTPVEKLRIAGDRIRLARGKVSAPKPKGSRQQTGGSDMCSEMLFPWN
jgi:hypothetical protein